MASMRNHIGTAQIGRKTEAAAPRARLMAVGSFRGQRVAPASRLARGPKLKWVWVEIKLPEKPQVLVFDSIYQNEPFWGYRLDPLPNVYGSTEKQNIKPTSQPKNARHGLNGHGSTTSNKAMGIKSGKSDELKRAQEGDPNRETNEKKKKKEKRKKTTKQKTTTKTSNTFLEPDLGCCKDPLQKVNNFLGV